MNRNISRKLFSAFLILILVFQTLSGILFFAHSANATVITPVLHVKANDSGTSAVVNYGTGPNGIFYVGGVATNVSSVPGKIGNALGFDNSGAVQKIDFPLTGTALDITGPITIAAWVNTSGGNNTVLGKESSFNEGYWLGITNSTRIFFYLDGVANTYTDVSSFAGTWTHLAATYDGSIIKIYKNGLLSYQTPATGSITNNPATLSIGVSSSYKLTGSIDDVRVYNQALNYYEINSIYNSGTGTENEIESIIPPSLPTNISLNAPYGISATAGNDNFSGGQRCFLNYNHRARIRSSQSIIGAQFYTGSNAEAFSDLRIQVWREVSDNSFTLVTESENLASSVIKGFVQYFPFNSPLIGVTVGDYIGLCANSSGNNLYAPSFSTGTLYYFSGNLVAPQVGYAWKSQSSEANLVIPIEIYSSLPKYVLIGDSIIAGHPNHYSFLENNTTTSLTSDIGYNLSVLDSGSTYQNMGIGSQKTTDIYNRFNTDVINLRPQIVVIEGGVNDIAESIAKSTFIANWTNMLNIAQADSNIKTIMILKILPWTEGTNVQMQTRDDWNTSLATLAASYSKAIVVDASSYVGQFRSGGDIGNLWDIKTAYNVDGVHFNSTGHGQIAQAIADNLPSSLAQITSFNFTSPSVTGAVNNTNHTIALTVPYGTSVISLTPTIVVSSGATVSPTSGTAKNFTSPVIYTVTAQDGVTTQQYTVTVTITADTTPPSSFTLSSPSDNFLTNNNTSTLSWNASSDAESGLAKYQLYINGTLNKDNIDPSSTSTTPTSALADGSYTWYVKALDNAGNSTQTTATRTINIDTVSSFATFSSGSPSDPTSQTSVDIIVAGTDITQYKYKLDSGNYSSATNVSSHLVLSDLADGEHTIYLIGKDSAGNWQAEGSTTTETWTVDATAPVISLSSPTNNSSTSDSRPTLSWSGSDATSGIFKYQLYLDSNLDKDNIATTSTTPTNPLSCGAHTWYVKAIDNATNFTNSDTFNLTMACGGGGLPPAAYNPPTVPQISADNPQGGFNVSINDNAIQTNIQTVNLKLTAGSDTKRMAISNTPDFIGASQEEYSPIKTWTLSEGDGTKTVYAKFYTQYGVASETVSDSIILKTNSVENQTGNTANQGSADNTNNPETNNPESVDTKPSLFTFTKTLQFGSNNTQVTELQDRLKELNFFPQSTASNGNFGPATRQAVMDYQRSKGINPNGIVGPRTRKALNSQEFITNKDHQFTKDLKYNDKNEEVKQLQTRLRDQNFFPYNVSSTGWFGPITEKAVNLFQGFYNLIKNGIVDPAVREVLNR